MWRSAQERIVGPSLSRKKRLRTVIATKKATDASFSTPPTTPWMSASKESLAPELTSWFAASALPGLTPRSLSQPSISSAPALRCLLIPYVSLPMPVRIR